MNPPPRASRRQYASIFEAAARVGASTKTIRRWTASGHLAGHRMRPRLLRLDPDELDKMLVWGLPVKHGTVPIRLLRMSRAAACRSGFSWTSTLRWT